MPIVRPAAALLLIFTLVPGSVRAQCETCVAPAASREGLAVAANALLGGVTAAARARLQGRPTAPAFWGGAGGGVLTYAGKRVVSERWGGAGALGRELAAVGSSLSANAGAGIGLADRLVLPAGPLRLYLAPRGPGARLRARVDLAAVSMAAYAVANGSRFDRGESLSSGALVFRARGGRGDGYDGRHAAGVIELSDGEDPDRVARSAAHERVHVIQYDQTFVLWAGPAERAALERAPWSRGLHRWADFGVNAPVLAALGAVVPYHAQPWEAEAVYLARSPFGAR